MQYQVFKKGYITLLSVIIMSAVGISIVTSVLLLGVNNARITLVRQEASQAQAILDGCIEDALQEIRSLTTYTGYSTNLFQYGSCEYLVSNTGGENRTIIASSTVNNITRRTEVVVDTISPQINIVSWEEVDSF